MTLYIFFFCFIAKQNIIVCIPDITVLFLSGLYDWYSTHSKIIFKHKAYQVIISHDKKNSQQEPLSIIA